MKLWTGLLMLGIWYLSVLLAAQEDSMPPEKERIRQLAETAAKLRPLHKRLGQPKPGEWMYEHKEMGQTFAAYTRSQPVTIQGARRIIYILPLGDFTASQRKILTITAAFMQAYFGTDVRVMADLPLTVIPPKARRKHPSWGMAQISSGYVLYDVLKPRLPEDACVLLALTATDLWPGENWNFVFGEASLTERVGVWSLYRNGDPAKSATEFRRCLLRTIKTATHETGHMFSLPHCIFYECGMCGSNHREEADRRPLWLCPECMAKLCFATGADPIVRYRALAELCSNNGLQDERKFYERSLATITAKDRQTGK